MRLAGGHQSGDLDIVHQADRDLLFAFQRGTRTAGRQCNDLPRPQRRNEPFHGVPRRMAAPHDVPVPVHFVSLGSDYFAGYRDIRSRETDAVELQLEIALTDEAPGLLVRLQMSSEVTSPGKNTLSEFPEAIQMANHAAAYLGSGCTRE